MHGRIGSHRQSSAWKCSRIKVVCMFKEGRALRLWRWPKPEPLPSLVPVSCLGLGGQMLWSFEKARRTGSSNFGYRQSLNPCHQVFLFWLQLLNDSCLAFGFKAGGAKLPECKEGRFWGFGHRQSLGPFPHLLQLWLGNSERFLLGIGWSTQWCEAFWMQGGQGLRVLSSPASPSAPSLTCSSCDLGVLKGSCLGLGGRMVWSFEKARRTGASNFGYRQSLNPCHQLFLFWLQVLNDSCLGFGFKTEVWSCPNARRAGSEGLAIASPSAPSLTCSSCDLNFSTILDWGWVVNTVVWSFPNARRAGPEGLAAAGKPLSPFLGILNDSWWSRQWCEASLRMQGGQGLGLATAKVSLFPHLLQLWLGNSERFSGVKLSESKGRGWGVCHRQQAPRPLPSLAPVWTILDWDWVECKQGRFWGFGRLPWVPCVVTSKNPRKEAVPRVVPPGTSCVLVFLEIITALREGVFDVRLWVLPWLTYSKKAGSCQCLPWREAKCLAAIGIIRKETKECWNEWFGFQMFSAMLTHFGKTRITTWGLLTVTGCWRAQGENKTHFNLAQNGLMVWAGFASDACDVVMFFSRLICFGRIFVPTACVFRRGQSGLQCASICFAPILPDFVWSWSRIFPVFLRCYPGTFFKQHHQELKTEHDGPHSNCLRWWKTWRSDKQTAKRTSPVLCSEGVFLFSFFAKIVVFLGWFAGLLLAKITCCTEMDIILLKKMPRWIASIYPVVTLTSDSTERGIDLLRSIREGPSYIRALVNTQHFKWF